MSALSTQDALVHFKYHRKLTLDLLRSLDSKTLQYTSATNQGSLGRQFRHLGRVTENYTQATRTGIMKFGPKLGTFSGSDHDSNALYNYLEKTLTDLEMTLFTVVEDLSIDWFGDSIPLVQHLVRLSEHEILHHGQWIVYMNIYEKNFPESWSVWGLV